jgi:hypothetical protein
MPATGKFGMKSLESDKVAILDYVYSGQREIYESKSPSAYADDGCSGLNNLLEQKEVFGPSRQELGMRFTAPRK